MVDKNPGENKNIFHYYKELKKKTRKIISIADAV